MFAAYVVIVINNVNALNYVKLPWIFEIIPDAENVLISMKNNGHT